MDAGIRGYGDVWMRGCGDVGMSRCENADYGEMALAGSERCLSVFLVDYKQRHASRDLSAEQAAHAILEITLPD